MAVIDDSSKDDRTVCQDLLMTEEERKLRLERVEKELGELYLQEKQGDSNSIIGELDDGTEYVPFDAMFDLWKEAVDKYYKEHHMD